MAGTDPRFDASRFRTAIKFVMQMSSPTDSTQDVTFHWKPERTYAQEDSGHKPFSWTATPVTDVEIADIQVDTAVSFAGQTAGGGRTLPAGTGVGEFDTTHGVITVLDSDWATVLAHSTDRVPDQVIIDGDYYDITFIAPPDGLFEVTIYSIHIASVDEH